MNGGERMIRKGAYFDRAPAQPVCPSCRGRDVIPVEGARPHLQRGIPSVQSQCVSCRHVWRSTNAQLVRIADERRRGAA